LTNNQPKINRIDFSKGQFKANGKTYYIQDSLTISRWKMYQRFQHVLAFNGTPEDHLEFVEFIIKILSGPVSGMAIHKILENALNIKDMYKTFISSEPDHWFKFAALFINREGEDVAVYDETIEKSKIADWTEAGIDAQDFFLLCARQSKALRVKYLQSPHLMTGEEEE
jgi:hypothetical protein